MNEGPFREYPLKPPVSPGPRAIKKSVPLSILPSAPTHPEETGTDPKAAQALFLPGSLLHPFCSAVMGAR